MLDNISAQSRKISLRLRKLLRINIGLNKRTLELGFVALLTILVVVLPFIYGTKTYPVAIVEGTSMYPDLQNGDMVFFHAVNPQTITNGTIIIYVQTDTGLSFFDNLLKPTIIHRVVGSFVQADGTLYFQTKGDNNNFQDPSAVPASHVLGTPVQVIPKAGFLLLFFSSPQGLVATIGFITILYLSFYESKLSEGRTKDTFLGSLANMVLNGALPEDVFKKFELAVKYVDDIEVEQLKEGLAAALVEWLEMGAKQKGWIVHQTECPTCSKIVRSFTISDKLMIVVCPDCIWQKKQDMRRMQLKSELPEN